MKQLDVQIMGQSYLLGCPQGGEAQFREAVQRVDAGMCRIRDAGKVKARDRIAVLAALNLAFELSERSIGSERPAAPAAEGGESAATTARDPVLDSLLQRLDAALDADGRLI